MKTLLILLLLPTFLVGCCCPHPPVVGQSYSCGWADYAVVNNTGVLIDVFQDGRPVACNVGAGQLVHLQSIWLRRYTMATVVGHEIGGGYVGSQSYRFNVSVPETWEVRRLNRPDDL